MKSKLFAVLCMSILTVSCQKDNEKVTPVVNNNAVPTSPNSGSSKVTGDMSYENQYGASWNGSEELSGGSKFISLLEANAMIGSYLYSIHSDDNDRDIRSFSVDADMLRAYLADNSIKNVKLIFGHTMGYMNSGNKGRNSGYQCGALTIIIAAYDNAGNYVYHDGKVLDHASPCPWVCPNGKAGSSFLY